MFGEWQNIILNESRDDRSILTVPQAIINLNGYVKNDMSSIAFIVEYEIAMVVPPNAVQNAKSILQTTVRNGSVIAAVTVGSGIIIASEIIDDHDDKPSNNQIDNNVQLKLRVDEVCMFLSNKPIYCDMDENGHSFLNHASQRAESKTEDLPENEFTPLTIIFDLTPDSAAQIRDDESDTPAGPGEGTGAGPNAAGTVEDHDGPSGGGGGASGKRPKHLDSPVDAKSDIRFEPGKAAVPSRITHGRRNEDAFETESISESLVSIDTDRSLLNLDLGHPDNMGLHDRVQPSRDKGRLRSPRAQEIAQRMLVPDGRPSLLSIALQSRLQTSPISKVVPPPTYPYADRDGYEEISVKKSTQLAHVSHQNAPLIGVVDGRKHFRNLSRAARSRLNRHGIDGAMLDNGVTGGDGMQISSLPNDIELEARDTLSLHEISIQFVGIKISNRSINEPKNVYFTFQFYTCLHTTTEILRLLPADADQINILVRELANARNEPPLSLRYDIDCSMICPTERREFAEYLSKCTLYVDVWDADSLLILGTFGVPLSRLMRQGQPSVKMAIESDIINPYLCADSEGGITNTKVSDGGPIDGIIVGSAHVILSNYGRSGQGQYLAENCVKKFEQPEETNWRTMGIDATVSRSPRNRPRNTVRARPLTESDPKLSNILVNQRSASGDGPSMRSLLSVRGEETSHTLNYDEVLTLFKKFKGTSSGTVQYVGDLMKLLDVPSWAVAIKKLAKLYQICEHQSPGSFLRVIIIYLLSFFKNRFFCFIFISFVIVFFFHQVLQNLM